MATGNFQPGRATAPVTKVELSISCKGLRDRDTFSKSDPMAVLFMKEFGNPKFVEIGRTERIQNTLSPEFAKKFLIDYHFEEAQTLKVEIYDIDSASAVLDYHDFLGRIECNLGEIVGAPGGKIHRNLSVGQGRTAGGSIILAAEEVGSNKDIAVMQWKGFKLDKKDFLGKSDPFIQIFRVEADGSTKLAHRSEHIDNTLNPVWKPFKIPVRNLCGDNIDRAIRFECYDWDSDGGQAHDLIGTFETTFRKLSQGANNPQNTYDLINPKKKAKKKDYKNSGQLQLAQFSIEVDYSFLDYIRGGTQLHFSVAVDFTASNGEPRDPKSLHYIHPQFPNQYMIALKSVGEIIQDYDYDKMFPALGFGAKLPPEGTLSHEFFLNFTHDPHCYGVNGILDAYRRSLMAVQLYGPTNFSPVINHVARFAAQARDTANSSKPTSYFILLIITDGAITDLDNTIASIIAASYLPMSIIIVGVGNADFAAMEFLDADKGRLQQAGRVAQRDIVQFVPMRKYVNGSNFELSQARLAKDVLAEVPLQLTSYMQKMGIKPLPPTQADISRPTPAPDTVPQGPHGPDTTPAPPPEVNLNYPPTGPGAPGQQPAYAPSGPGAPGQAPPGYAPSGPQAPGQAPPGYAPSGPTAPGYPPQGAAPFGGYPGAPPGAQGYPQGGGGFPQQHGGGGAAPAYSMQAPGGYPQQQPPGYPGQGMYPGQGAPQFQPYGTSPSPYQQQFASHGQPNQPYGAGQGSAPPPAYSGHQAQYPTDVNKQPYQGGH